MQNMITLDEIGSLCNIDHEFSDIQTFDAGNTV